MHVTTGTLWAALNKELRAGILGALRSLVQAPHPNPLPQGEGKESIPHNQFDDLLVMLLTLECHSMSPAGWGMTR
jgi:hypothetical protein